MTIRQAPPADYKVAVLDRWPGYFRDHVRAAGIDCVSFSWYKDQTESSCPATAYSAEGSPRNRQRSLRTTWVSAALDKCPAEVRSRIDYALCWPGTIDNEYKSLPALRRLSHAPDLNSIGDKLALCDILERSGVDHGRHPEYFTPESLASSARKQTTVTALLQPSYGSGGTNTYEGPVEELLTRWSNDGRWRARISLFVDGISSNVSAFSYVSQKRKRVVTLVDIPTHKGVGLESYGLRRFQSGGNQRRGGWPQTELETLQKALSQIGEHLWTKYGFVGHFGVDLVWRQDDSWVITEINPRIQGTTQLSGNGLLADELWPFTVCAVVSAYGFDLDDYISPDAYHDRLVHGGSSLGDGEYYVKLRWSGSAAVVSAPDHVAYAVPTEATRVDEGSELGMIWGKSTDSVFTGRLSQPGSCEQLLRNARALFRVHTPRK